MARKPGSNPQAIKNRAAKTAAVMTSGGAAAPTAPPKKPVNLGQFAREVRAEARKITWTSGRETWITSVMVAIMVVLASVFFFVVDLIIGSGMQQLLKLVNAG